MLTGLTQYVPEATLTIYDNLEFLLRLLLSAALGALVGLERSKRRKEAGIRTHCIIACTSALFMIVSKYAFLDCLNIDGLRGADPARIAAQVVSGISFLGAGVIFKNGNSIRGLTTAAGMWGTAAIGMAVGAGNAAGANSGIVITGLDGTPDGYEAIKDGRITGTVAQDGGLMASSGVEAAVTLLDGGTLENNLIIADSVWIDSSNVADYE